MPKEGRKKKKGDKKNTSLRLPGKTLKALKLRALQEDTSVQALVERLIEAYLATPLATEEDE